MAKKIHGNQAKVSSNKKVSSTFITNNVVSKKVKDNGEPAIQPIDEVILAKKEVDANEK